MALGPDGEVYVAERGVGRVIRLPDRDGDGVADGSEVVSGRLRAPSSIAFLNGSLYVGETTRVVRLSDPDELGVFHAQETLIDGLPSGGHNTRTVLFSPDGSSLFVSIGSSCNVCAEPPSVEHILQLADRSLDLGPIDVGTFCAEPIRALGAEGSDLADLGSQKDHSSPVFVPH